MEVVADAASGYPWKEPALIKERTLLDDRRGPRRAAGQEVRAFRQRWRQRQDNRA